MVGAQCSPPRTHVHRERAGRIAGPGWDAATLGALLLAWGPSEPSQGGNPEHLQAVSSPEAPPSLGEVATGRSLGPGHQL